MRSLLYLAIYYVGVAFTGHPTFGDDFDADEVLSIHNKANPDLQIRLNAIGFAENPNARGLKRKRVSKPNGRYELLSLLHYTI